MAHGKRRAATVVTSMVEEGMIEEKRWMGIDAEEWAACRY